MPEWQTKVNQSGMEWLKRVNKLLEDDENQSGIDSDNIGEIDAFFAETINQITHLAPVVTIEQLGVLAREEAKTLCRALITLHVIADEACVGVGLLVSPSPPYALAHCLANLLLTARGSLSAIPKYHGTVLPKLRTPQSGLTLRSLSHQVTYHASEVEVMWRAMPWANIEENTINVLCVPWPFKVEDQCFAAERETFQSVRYFRYEPSVDSDEDRLSKLVDLIKTIDTQIARVHIVVFPEMALRKEDYEKLMQRLLVARVKKELAHIPIIIAGVWNQDPIYGDLNEVRLAAYFAGKWYELSQRKHHRWKLNRSQIRQYGLEGRLATARHWYESIPIAQRRLTFMAPTGWLALCPLICEDLAQLEPISELIRGVGPTLLMALLLDGPQLKERWSARYASVLADDPGTAVLTLTSLGMVERSRRVEGDNDNEPPLRTVSLWKDQITGWRTLDLGTQSHAVMLTISADWQEEYSVDGRSDNTNAAVFKFEGVRQFEFKETVPEDYEYDIHDHRWLGDWADIRELTAMTYVLDVAIELQGQHLETILNWLLARPGKTHHEEAASRKKTLIDLLRQSLKTPEAIGVDARQDQWPTESLEWAVSTIQEWFSTVIRDDEPQSKYWMRLTKEAILRLEHLHAAPGSQNSGDSTDQVSDADRQRNLEKQRVERSIPLAVLGALHTRVEQFRKTPLNRLAQPQKFTFDDAADLLHEIEEALTEYG